MEFYKNEIQRTSKNWWGNEVLNYLKLKVKNWTYLVKDRTPWCELVQKTKKKKKNKEKKKVTLPFLVQALFMLTKRLGVFVTLQPRLPGLRWRFLCKERQNLDETETKKFGKEFIKPHETTKGQWKTPWITTWILFDSVIRHEYN